MGKSARDLMTGNINTIFRTFGGDDFLLNEETGEKDSSVTSVQEQKRPVEEEAKKPREKDSKTQSKIDNKRTGEKECKKQIHKEDNISESRRDARCVTRGECIFYPTNMLMRRDLHKALKIAAIENGVPEYEILNDALSRYLLGIKEQ